MYIYKDSNTQNSLGAGWMWLASPSANNTNNVLKVNYDNGGNVNNDNYNNNNAFCPLDSLRLLWIVANQVIAIMRRFRETNRVPLAIYCYKRKIDNMIC